MKGIAGEPSYAGMPSATSARLAALSSGSDTSRWMTIVTEATTKIAGVHG